MLIGTNALIEECVKIIDIKNGPMYFQIKLTAKGPRIIEIAPRLDGCHLWQLIKYCYGVDLLDLTFRVLLDQSLDVYGPLNLMESAQLIFSHTPPEEIYTSNGKILPTQMIHHVAYYQEGDRVMPINGILEKTGYVIVEEP
jgi:biotin carboxylase